MGKTKLNSITIPVPYKSAGNSIRQKEVSFDVFRDGDTYALVPALTEAELRIANLPPQLEFRVQDGKAVSLRGPQDGNLHVIQDGLQKMKSLNLVPS